MTVSVTGVEDNETLVTVKAEPAGQAALTEGGQQSKLISFVIDKLTEKFPLSENQAKPVSGRPVHRAAWGWYCWSPGQR